MSAYILALDQGTTSSRAILFDRDGSPVSQAHQEFPQIFPRPGRVEHNPEEIWSSQMVAASHAIARAGIDIRKIASIGITNQRETTILWERSTGHPVHNAIVWQFLGSELRYGSSLPVIIVSCRRPFCPSNRHCLRGYVLYRLPLPVHPIQNSHRPPAYGIGFRPKRGSVFVLRSNQRDLSSFFPGLAKALCAAHRARDHQFFVHQAHLHLFPGTGHIFHHVRQPSSSPEEQALTTSPAGSRSSAG